jgi:hypothetical protein
MELKSNSLFKELVPGNIEPDKFSKCAFTHDLLSEDIVVIDGCYFFNSLKPDWLRFTPYKYLVDRTGEECFHNKIHIDNIIDADTPEQQLKCGLYFSYYLAKKIEATFGHGFNVLLSYDGEYCVVRFHQIRINEKWLADNLENYMREAILLITT